MEEKQLVISHRLFLSKDQRYSLYKDNTIIEITGKYLSVWKKGNKTNEPCEEVECSYTITNERSNNMLVLDKDKCHISLPNYEARRGLLDPKDGGSKSFLFCYQNADTTHYIIFGDYEEMVKSTVK